MSKLTAELLQTLKSAAQEEIMCREASDTSDAWQDLASPENVLALLEIVLPVLEQQVVVPGGWRLVPVEPTEEMIAAGDQFMDGLSRLGDAYEAMLAAAPQPSTTPQIDNDGREG